MIIERNINKQGKFLLTGRSLWAFFWMVFFSTGIFFTAMMILGGTPAIAQETLSKDGTPPPEPGEDVTPMDESFKEPPAYPVMFPSLKEKLKNTTPFLRDTKFDIELRTYYLYRDKFDDSKNEAWALGGYLAYQSGWLLDHFDIGAVLYTSQPLYAPNDRGGTLLLTSDQEGYTVLGQLYGRIKIIEDNFINIYQYEYNTPYINKNDNRMTPNTFEGYTLTGAWGGKDGAPKFTYGGGYIDKIKPRNADKFIPMSEAAGVDQTRGVVTGGANAIYKKFSIGAIDYYSEDILNIFYTEGKYTAEPAKDMKIVLNAQFTDQRSVGDDLQTGSSFNTNQTGIKADMSAMGATVSLALTTDAKGADLQNPWSSCPGYTSVQVQDFNRAGESAFLLKGAYDFSKLHLPGVTAYALWVHGWGAVDPVTKEDVYQQDEYDFDLQWRPKGMPLKGLWFRVRYAHVDQRDGGDEALNDFRIIVNYDFSLL